MTERPIELATADATLFEIETMLDSKAFPTGSRVICPGAVSTTSDWDYLFHVEDLTSAAIALGEMDFDLGRYVDPVQIVNGPKRFVSLRRGFINVLLTNDPEFFEAFRLATRVATKLGLTNKADRVTLFQAVLYGNG